MLKTGFTSLCCAVLAGMTLLPAETSAQSNHYLCDFPFQELRNYQERRWLPSELPIKVYIPPVPYVTPNPKIYIPLVQQAFLSWTKVAPALRFSFVDQPDQAQIKIDWKEHFPEDERAWGRANYPIPQYNRSRQLTSHRSTIFLAIKAQPGTGMALRATLFSYDELLAVATHEVGHALGLTHSKNPNDIMSQYIYKYFAESKWAISQRDINTLYILYGLPKQLKAHPLSLIHI